MKELVPVLAAVALEGIKSIQTIGVEWKRDKPTRFIVLFILSSRFVLFP
jgi:hypothetical protein